MRTVIERNFVNVIGHIWQPGIGVCAMTYTLGRYEVENIGDFTRENVEEWLTSHSGDFQEVLDFEATVGDKWISWADEESEMTYLDCTSERFEDD